MAVVNEVEDVYAAHLRFTYGAVGSVTSGWAGRGPEGGWNAPPALYGTLGAVHGDQVYGHDGYLGRAPELVPADTAAAWFPAGVRDPFGLELLAFVRTVTDSQPLETTAAAGTRDLAAAYAVLESALAKRSVAVEAVADGTVAAYQEPINAHYGL